MKAIGFIGCGNMGGALATAVAKAYDTRSIYLSEKDNKKSLALAEKTGCRPSDNREIAEFCDLIFLGVKPQVMPSLLDSISTALAERTKRNNRFVLVSMAAGISTDSICEMARGKYPVIRIMPNIPVSVGEGMILYCANEMVKAEELQFFREIFVNAGKLDELPEKLISAGSAVSGCGPAYALMFLQSMAEGGIKCGLPYDKALLYAAQTVIGSAKLLLAGNEHPEKLKDAVCSPAGSTIEGVNVLENAAFRAAVINAVDASYKRTEELGKK